MRPLADYFVDAFNKPRRAPVMSVIALVDNHWWAYECHLPGCCEGEPLPGLDDPNSVTAQLIRLDRTPGRRASDITQEFLPAEPEDAADLLRALDNEGAAWAQHCATPSDDGTVLQATHTLLETAIRDFRNGATELAHDITARLIYGLNDEWAQVHGLEHLEDDDLPHTRRLWAFLASRCLPPYEAAAVPALNLLAAVAWRQDDQPTARFALQRALTLDPNDEFADAIHGRHQPRTRRHDTPAHRPARRRSNATPAPTTPTRTELLAPAAPTPPGPRRGERPTHDNTSRIRRLAPPRIPRP